MPNVTISVDAELYAEMKKHSFINWSALARVTFKSAVSALAMHRSPQEVIEQKILKLIVMILK